jgi:hypothetical protein
VFKYTPVQQLDTQYKGGNADQSVAENGDAASSMKHKKQICSRILEMLPNGGARIAALGVQNLSR